MLDQLTFDRSEEIADALHQQDGLSIALLNLMDGKLSLRDEHIFLSLLGAQDKCRDRALKLVTEIASLGGPSG